MFEFFLGVAVTFIVLVIIGYSLEHKEKQVPKVVVVPIPVLEELNGTQIAERKANLRIVAKGEPANQT